ncbi:MAG: hypothetical protein Q4B85_12025 [Lachnospiraceae bacterium]|nr:hypothetical protein [Lachnospiraceae bacterium]
MNRNVLVDFISRELHTFVRTLSYDGKELSSYCAIPELSDPCYRHFSLEILIQDTLQSKAPLLFSYRDIIYAIVDFKKGVYLVGPVLFDATISLYKNIHIDQDYNDIENWLLTLPRINFEEFIKNILFFHNMYADSVCERYALASQNLAQRPIAEELHRKYTKLVFINQENSFRHNPYEQEVREQASIEKGDIEGLKKSIEEDFIGDFGTLSNDPVRNMKNLFIVNTTLASRSAIRGGLSPELSFSLSDSYIQKVEEMTNVNNIYYFVRDMEYHYASLVRDIRSERNGNAKKNPHIEKCKNYIFSHLHCYSRSLLA